MSALVLGALGRIPVLAWVLVAVLAWGGWQRWQAVRAADDLRTVTAQVEAANAAVLSATEAARRAAALQEIVDDQTRKLDQARADADAATAAGQRLRAQLAAYRRTAGQDSTSAAVRSATDTAASVLADVLGRCSDRREELARFADAAHAAGRTCERAYDSLTPGRDAQ